MPATIDGNIGLDLSAVGTEILRQMQDEYHTLNMYKNSYLRATNNTAIVVGNDVSPARLTINLNDGSYLSGDSSSLLAIGNLESNIDIHLY